MKPPRARSAKLPIDSGIGHAVLLPVAGSKQLSDGALMSTQYRTLSSAHHTGHSPRLALTSSTQVKAEVTSAARRRASSVRALRLGWRASGRATHLGEIFLPAADDIPQVRTHRDPGKAVFDEPSRHVRVHADDAR